MIPPLVLAHCPHDCYWTLAETGIMEHLYPIADRENSIRRDRINGLPNDDLSKELLS